LLLNDFSYKNRQSILCLFFFLTNFSHTVFSRESLVDANYKLSRLQQRDGYRKADTNELLQFYVGILKHSMYSHCSWFPSDSQYMKAYSFCGAEKAALFAVSRFMYETDAYRLVKGYVNDKEHVRFLDFRKTCDFLDRKSFNFN
jgi:hypothetical protein